VGAKSSFASLSKGFAEKKVSRTYRKKLIFQHWILQGKELHKKYIIHCWVLPDMMSLGVPKVGNTKR